MRPIKDRIIVEVDQDLQEIIPAFLHNRANDIADLKKAVEVEQFEHIRIVGHTLKGIGSGYGFDLISDIGLALEQAAKSGNSVAITKTIQELETYLELVDIIYV